MPITPFSGVRNSWLSAARCSCGMPGREALMSAAVLRPRGLTAGQIELHSAAPPWKIDATAGETRMARMLRTIAVAAALWLGAQAPAIGAAPGDGFAPFWQAFSAALTRDDQPALAKMVVLSD